MLHNQDPKSKGENDRQRDAEMASAGSESGGRALNEKGRLSRSLPFFVASKLGSVLVGFFPDKGRHIEVFCPCMHHGPEGILRRALNIPRLVRR